MMNDEDDWADMVPVIQVGEEFYTSDEVQAFIDAINAGDKTVKELDEQIAEWNKRVTYLLGALEHGRKKDVAQAIEDVSELLQE